MDKDEEWNIYIYSYKHKVGLSLLFMILLLFFLNNFFLLLVAVVTVAVLYHIFHCEPP